MVSFGSGPVVFLVSFSVVVSSTFSLLYLTLIFSSYFEFRPPISVRMILTLIVSTSAFSRSTITYAYSGFADSMVTFFFIEGGSTSSSLMRFFT